MSNLTLKDVLELNTTKRLYISFGMFCQYYEIDSEDFCNYELFLSCGNIEWNIDKQEFESIKENQIYNFFRRLKTEDYRAILLNNQEVLTDDDKFTDYFYENLVDNLDNASIIMGCDSLKVICDNGEIKELKGYEKMSYFEILTRQFLKNECGEDFGLVVKTDVWQNEFEDNQIKDINDYYEKCKGIKFAEFIEENKAMNGNAIKVIYKDGKTEIWQPL